jgi:hypothetical protein
MPLLFLAAIAGVGTGYGTKLNVFTKCDFGVHLLALFLYLVAMVAMSLFIASFVTRPRWVNLASFIVFAFAVVLQVRRRWHRGRCAAWTPCSSERRHRIARAFPSLQL